MKRILVLILLTASLSSAYSQTFFDIAAKKNWKGEGILLGTDAKFNMEWEKVLGGQFYQLKFQNERVVEGQKITFNAISYYKPDETESFTGAWFDSRGVTFPLKGTFTDNSLVVDWGTSDTEVGRSIYTVNADGTISVEDYIQKGESNINFGKATYK